ncbi:MAG: hypothetical protein ACYTFV_17510, partial [Planctomycetota bacterium]
MGDAVEIERTDLGPGARAARIGAAWGAFLLGSPGTLEPGGHVLGALLFAALWLGALLFAALWCSTAVRPGRAAFWIEWALASIGFGVLMGWLAYISTPAVPAAGIGMGFYAAVFRVPPLLAATVAWVGFETLRDLIPTPFGMGWLRLGHLAADIELLAGSARWYGVVGLSFVLTGVGAGATALLGPRPLPAVERRVARLFVTALPVLAVGLSSFGAPEVEAGPTVLLVQPNIGPDGAPGAAEHRAGTQAARCRLGRHHHESAATVDRRPGGWSGGPRVLVRDVSGRRSVLGRCARGRRERDRIRSLAGCRARAERHTRERQ